VLHSGEHVDAATQLAECGNSGNASEPHVHFQLMDWSRFRIAAGLASPVPIPGIDQSDQLAEEIGFTGFLQHHWQDRYHPMKLTVYVALLWALWHVPDHFAEEGWGVEQLIAAPVVFAIGFVSLFFARALLV
jgi:hypothetical protein